MKKNLEKTRIKEGVNKLLFGVIELTTACNLRCVHCGSNAGFRRKNELDTKEMKDLIDQFADLGAVTIAFTGGEPLIRKDWFELAMRVKKRKMGLSILTNGLIVDDDIVKQLDQVEPIAVNVSIDGIGETHDKFRGIDGAFEKALNTLKLMACRLPHCVVTTVTKHNILELPKLFELMISLNVWTWQIQMGIPIGRLNRAETLNLSEIRQVAEYISETRNKISQIEVVTADCIGYYAENLNLRDSPWKGCLAGRILASVTSDGNVVGCLSMPPSVYEGNIRVRSLKEIWENKNSFAYNRQWSPADLEGRCKICDKKEDCRAGCNSVKLALDSLKEYPFCLR